MSRLHLQVFKRAAEKEITIDVTERFTDRLVDEARVYFSKRYSTLCHGLQCGLHGCWPACCADGLGSPGAQGLGFSGPLAFLTAPEPNAVALQGYNPAYGARPLRRAIMRLLEDSMAERMLSGEIKARRAP